MRVKHLTSTQEVQGVPWPQQPGYGCVCISSRTYLCAEVRAGKAVRAPMRHPTAKLGDLQRVLLRPRVWPRLLGQLPVESPAMLRHMPSRRAAYVYCTPAKSRENKEEKKNKPDRCPANQDFGELIYTEPWGRPLAARSAWLPPDLLPSPCR